MGGWREGGREGGREEGRKRYILSASVGDSCLCR